MSQPEPLLKVLTPQQAADVLGCSKPHIYRLIASGELTAVDISAAGSKKSKTRIRMDDLNAYLESNIVAV